MSSPDRDTHRTKLLEAAGRLLRERQYANITARDLVTASGTNLGSIGYHFGSKEALLNAAIGRAVEEWTTRLGEAAFAGEDQSPLGQMAASWVAMLDSFEELRPVLVGFVEAVGQSAWSEGLRQELAAHYNTVREQVASMVRASLGEDAKQAGIDPKVIASFLIAVCDGLVLQWLLDPAETPNGEELISSLGSALSQSLQVASIEP